MRVDSYYFGAKYGDCFRATLSLKMHIYNIINKKITLKYKKSALIN